MATLPELDILLVNPAVADYPYPHLPLGLAELKAWLDQREFRTAVLDTWAEGLSDLQIRDFIEVRPSSALGITVTSFTLDHAKRIAAIAKSVAPAMRVIAGGPHPSYDPANFLTYNPDFDVVVVGEGEATLAALLSAGTDASKLSQIDGLAFRGPDGRLSVNPPRQTRMDLDALPLPAFGAFPVQRYLPHAPYGRRKPYFNLISSRGCPFTCVFCSNSVFGQRVRLKSAARVYQEVEWVRTSFGAREVHFYDDVFTINAGRVMEFCNLMIANRNPVIWSCTTRVDLVTQEMLHLMRKAGCWLVTFGVESGSDAVLRLVDKKYTKDQVRAAFTMARRAGLRIHSFFMVGLPGDTAETIEETIAFAKEIKPHSSHWSVLYALPGSRVFEVYRRPDREHRAIPYDRGLSSEVLAEFRKKAIREIFFSPGYMVRVLVSIRSVYELRNAASSAWRLLRGVVRKAR